MIIYIEEYLPNTPTSNVFRIKHAPNATRNLGSLCHERHPRKVHLDFSKPLIDWIANQGGDFLNLNVTPLDGVIRVGSGAEGAGNSPNREHRKESACWAGNIYVSWREYRDIRAAIDYLKRYFNVRASPNNNRITQAFIDGQHARPVTVSTAVNHPAQRPPATGGRLIKHPYPNPISSIVSYGSLAIPDLDWVASTQQLDLKGKGVGTIPSMFTTVEKSGWGNTLKRYLPKVRSGHHFSPSDFQILEAGILYDINTVVLSGKRYRDNELLPHIAAGIHFWGGNSGRNAFVQGKGFLNNCPMATYGDMAESIIENPAGVMPPEGNWRTVFALAARLENIGVAFATKHISFWSKASKSMIRLPILDSLIYEKFISPKGPPQWQHYVPFVMDFERIRKIVEARPGLSGITLDQMERQLFNWMNTPASQSWFR